MNAYSEDLRKKIVEALRRGKTKSESARAFGVSRSSVKRYAKLAQQGRPLAPKKRPGSKPKIGGAAGRLLEGDLERRPAATLPERREFLKKAAGVSVSDSTVSRMLKRPGWSRKKIAGSGRARRVPEGRMAAAGSRGGRRRASGVRGRDGGQRLAGAHLRLVAPRKSGARESAAQPGQERDPAREHHPPRGVGPCLAVEGSTTREVFEAYLERVLAPTLRPGQVVLMGNLSAHKGGRVKEIVEGRDCELLYLPPYSPDFNPIEGAFSKVKGLLRRAEARTREALIEAKGRALDAVSARDARGFFGHCGYRSVSQLL